MRALIIVAVMVIASPVAGQDFSCRMGTQPEAECILVIIGATPEGRKELLGFHVGIRESAQIGRASCRERVSIDV